VNSPPELEAVPRFREMVWLILMQPVRLHRRLRMSGIDEIESVHYQLSSDSIQRAARNLYVQQFRRVVLSIMPIGALLIAASVHFAIVLPPLGNVALGIALGVYTGLFAALSGGVIMGELPGIALAIMSGLAYGFARGPTAGVEFGAALLIAKDT
jgi:hypothetical protein